MKATDNENAVTQFCDSGSEIEPGATPGTVCVPEPETAALLRLAALSGAPPFHAMTPGQARDFFAQRVQATNLAPEPVDTIRDIAAFVVRKQAAARK